MPRKSKKYHFIYKTTNTVNGKYYIGIHSTDDLDDGYIGSGKRLWYSIRKYGRDKFVIERLEFFETRDLLVEREKTLIDDEMLKDPMCMNLTVGGFGGWHYCNANGLNNSPEKRIKLSKWKSAHNKILYEQGILKRCDWTGKKHKQDTKDKIGITNSIKQQGIKNSQYGTCWITNGIENKKIKQDELNFFISDGWTKGRII